MRTSLLSVLALAAVFSHACADDPGTDGGAWYEDVVGEAPLPVAIAELPAVPPLDADGVERYAAVGHALLPVERTRLETVGVPTGPAETRLGLILVGGARVGLDLVDWRRKDALELLRIRQDLAGVIHLDPKQICNKKIREAIRDVSPEAISLSFAPTSRNVGKLPACLEALEGTPLHLQVPAADGAVVEGLARLEGLETLVLRAPELDADAMAALGKSKALHTLDLGAALIDHADLSRLSSLGRLESLSLFGTSTDDTTLEHLPNRAGLRFIDLGFTAVGDRGLAHLAECRSLRSIGLWHTNITHVGLEALASLEHLVSLDLAGTGIDDRGISALLTHSGLRRLDLTGTEVTDAELAALAGLPALEVLRLGSTDITDGGLLSLAAYPRLQVLDLRGCAVTESAVEALRRVRPEMDIRQGQ